MQQVGVQLVADGGDKYLATLTQSAAAETKLAAAAESAVGGVNALDDRLGGADKAAASFAEMSQMAARNAAKFGDQADAAAADAAQFGTSADKAAGDLGGLGRAADKAGKETKQSGDDAEKGSKGFDFLKQAAIGAARELGGKLLNAAQEAGQAVLQFAGDTINKAGDFEQQMNRFASVTGDALEESGQSLEDFKQLFISLGRELPVSTAEVQQAAIEMAKGGIEPATIAAGGLRDVLNLAAAGEVGIAEAAEIASKQLGVWVDSAASADEKAKFLTQSVDLLSQAANASTVDVDDLALGLANTGKSADLAGLSFRETVTSMALISSGFSSAADAGTSFKTFLMRLQPTTDAQAVAFQKLNLLTAEGTSAFYDATGSFIGMDKAAALLKNGLEGMSDAQKEAALTAAFGSDAIRAAGMLADAGAEGYAHMAAEMAKAGSAAVQAAKKQQGYNVAMDNMMGSVEAFQITVGTAMLPALTSLINLLASGINAITDYADATMKGETALAQAADVINTLFAPAVAMAGAALVAYAYTQIPAAVAALPGLIAKVTTATASFAANAVAVAAAAAPILVFAAAVGGAALVIDQLNKKVEAGATTLLESRTWWNEATLAIQDYTTQVDASKAALAPYATEIQNIQAQLQREVEDLAKREAAGLVSDAQRTTEMAHINALAEALKGATGRYNEQESSLLATAKASMTATAQAQSLTQGEQVLGTQTSLTAKEIEDLGKKIQDTFQKGQEALNAYSASYSEFATGVEARASEFKDKIAELEAEKAKATTDEQKKGIDDQISQLKTSYAEQEQAAAASYANQQALQKQHLGQMLIDYTVSQAELGNIAKDKAAEITAALEKEYGLQESSTATTFLNMAQSIDEFASSSGESVNGLIGDLRDQQHQAAETQKTMDAYAKEYVATQTNNFLDGKQDADEYIRSLESIPTEITTNVVTRYTSEGKPDTMNEDATVGGMRAEGGPVDPMTPYVVGERGPEIVTPTTAGYVTPHDAVQRAMASTAQLQGMFTPSGAAPVQRRETTLNYNPVYGAGVQPNPYMDAQIARAYLT